MKIQLFFDKCFFRQNVVPVMKFVGCCLSHEMPFTWSVFSEAIVEFFLAWCTVVLH